MSAALALEGVSKAYGEALAVDRVDLAVAPGELIALLGPSGCGKTTTLRMVAGFVLPTAGRILLAGRDVTAVPPHKRDTGMVFQSYALFPHLTVEENIAFGLRRRGTARAEVARRVAEMVALLKLGGLERRLPRQLSGGQQQRVAVGRALVINPAVMLLDEPLSNLDAQLRESTRTELRRLQQSLGLTAVFVTHDQAEAMAIADRIAVMNRGRVEQVGSPQAIYSRPASRFVAGFIGRANLIEGTAEPDGAGALLHTERGLALRLPEPARGRVCAVLRPEAVALAPEAETAAMAGDGSTAAGRVEAVTFLGAVAQIEITLDSGETITAEGPGALAARFAPGTRVRASWPPDSLAVCAA